MTFALIHPVIALVTVTRLPLEYAVSVLHVVPEVSIVLITIDLGVFFPPPSTIFKTISEVAYIRGSIVPLVGAEAVRFAIFVITRE